MMGINARHFSCLHTPFSLTITPNATMTHAWLKILFETNKTQCWSNERLFFLTWKHSIEYQPQILFLRWSFDFSSNIKKPTDRDKYRTSTDTTNMLKNKLYRLKRLKSAKNIKQTRLQTSLTITTACKSD